MTLAAQAAEKDGLAATPDVQSRLDLLHMQILAEAASEKYVKSHPVSDDEVKAAYDSEVANMPKEYKARHILVETKEAADAIIKELQAGGDFAKIAKAQSKDPGSAAKGGDLGWFSAQTMVKPFADALAKLEKGKTTTEPVQTQYGYHVIRLEDVRAPSAPGVRGGQGAGEDVCAAEEAAVLPGRSSQDGKDSEDRLTVKFYFCWPRPVSCEGNRPFSLGLSGRHQHRSTAR